MLVHSPSLQIAFLRTIESDTLCPNRSLMLSTWYRIMVGLRGRGGSREGAVVVVSGENFGAVGEEGRVWEGAGCKSFDGETVSRTHITACRWVVQAASH